MITGGVAFVSVATSVQQLLLHPEYTTPRGCYPHKVVGIPYDVYNYGMAVLAGVVSAVLSCKALRLFLEKRRHMKTVTKSVLTMQAKQKFNREFRTMAIFFAIAISDVLFVVLPNIFIIYIVAINSYTSLSGLIGYLFPIASLRSLVTDVVLLAINKDYKEAIHSMITKHTNQVHQLNG